MVTVHTDPRLLGAWQLEYASTAQLQQERALLPPPSATTSLALLMQVRGRQAVRLWL